MSTVARARDPEIAAIEGCSVAMGPIKDDIRQALKGNAVGVAAERVSLLATLASEELEGTND